ncbi:MAG: DUF2652 domain-containing protein [Limisphaerales bacterium]
MPAVPAPASAPEPVLLVIADISGYTRFMTANAKSLAHSQTIITELVHALLHHAALPLEVAKLEGDAVFFFARRPARDPNGDLGRRLLGFFEVFRATLRALAGANACTCGACTHLDSLRLKLVIHAGEALFHEVAGFRELAGLDVIIVHRLLKNSVAAREYLLLTDAAREFVTLPDGLPAKPVTETYEEVGPVRTSVYLPAAVATDNSPAPAAPGPGYIARWQLKLWGGVLAGPARSGREFRHVETRTGPAGRTALAAASLALSPLLLPVNLLNALLRRRPVAQATVDADAAPRQNHP